MENENNGEYPKEVIERLKGYADRTGKKIGEAANEFNA